RRRLGGDLRVGGRLGRCALAVHGPVAPHPGAELRSDSRAVPVLRERYRPRVAQLAYSVEELGELVLKGFATAGGIDGAVPPRPQRRRGAPGGGGAGARWWRAPARAGGGGRRRAPRPAAPAPGRPRCGSRRPAGAPAVRGTAARGTAGARCRAVPAIDRAPV